jgi:hypothetical protein
MADTIVGIIPKNAREELRIGLSDFKGSDLVNLRVWFKAQDGAMRPGNAGVAMRTEKLPEIIAALHAAEAAARSRGLLAE